MLVAALSAVCAAEPLQDQTTEAAAAPAEFKMPEINTSPVEVEVIGGEISTDRRVVGIAYVDNSGTNRVCSGLWLSRDFVLTAAHCTCNNSTGVYAVTNANTLENDWRRAKFHRRLNDTFCVTKQPRLGDDLALLALDASLPSDTGVKTTCAYSLLDEIVLGVAWIRNAPRRIQVAGYGFVGDGPIGERRSASVGVNTLTCGEPAAQAMGCWPLSEFILGAGRTDGEIRDTCAGDSGGPAYILNGERFIPIGVVSRGLPIAHPYRSRGMCGAGGIYTHVGRRNVIAWLKQAGVPSGTAFCR
jgi:secreted trypsin-like serine protease